MALRALLLRKKIDTAKAALEEMRKKDADFEKREKELEAAVAECTEETTEDEKKTVEEAVGAFDGEKKAHEDAKTALEKEVSDLENELKNIERAAEKPAEIRTEIRKDDVKMEIRSFSAMTMEQREAFVARVDIKEFLERTRALASQKRAVNGANLLIPDAFLGLIRHEIAQQSKLLRFVRLVNISGKGRQNIAGAIPEAVWTEMCANLNELNIVFNQVEVDGYKVGGYIAVCNATLEDSDVNLASEIVSAIGGAIAKALDKAILFGTGIKMPIGIATRLAQTSEPESWEANAPAWTDLHTSNVLKLNIGAESGAAFFASLVGALGVAKPYYSSDGLFWVMNRKTHLAIMAKALAVNANAAIVSNTEMFPIVGGTIVEMEDDQIADNEIIGGFGGNYLMAQRAGIEMAQSDHVFFLNDQTVFKGTARYDGKPVAGEAFVIVNFNNTDPTTSKTFPVDYANADMNGLAVTAAASSTTSGKTVLTVTGYLAASTPVLKYKIMSSGADIAVGDKVTGFTDLTSGTTEITAAAGKNIVVVELDAANRVVSLGEVKSIPKSA